MFDCSYDAEQWIRRALKCVPEGVWDRIQREPAFICMDTSDGRRIVREICDAHEIILFSERVVPRGPLREDHPKVRYFWYIALHEVAHAYCDHVSPKTISVAKNAAQEDAADELAYSWFNAYLKSKNLQEFTAAELNIAMALSNEEAVRLVSAQEGLAAH